MRNRDSSFCLPNSFSRLREADGRSDVSDCDGGEEDRWEHPPSPDHRRARKLARTLLQKEEERPQVFESAREDDTLKSYQKLVFPVDSERAPWFSNAPLELLLDMPESLRVFYIPKSGLHIAFDQMSMRDHNENWDLWNSGLSIRGDAVLFRVGDIVDEYDRDNGWQFVFKNPPVPVKVPQPAPETRRRGIRRSRPVDERVHLGVSDALPSVAQERDD